MFNTTIYYNDFFHNANVTVWELLIHSFLCYFNIIFSLVELIISFLTLQWNPDHENSNKGVFLTKDTFSGV